MTELSDKSRKLLNSEEYDPNAIRELIDNIMITQNRSKEYWINFAWKYGIVKKTTKTIYPKIIKRYVSSEIITDDDGVVRMVDVDPHNAISAILRNGRNQTVWSVRFREEEIPQILEGLNNETIASNE